jgi:antitoxin component YwqK of YwqJK toxin-antitoxin module
MKNSLTILLIFITTFLYSENHRRIFKSIEESDYVATNVLLTDLKKNVNIDTAITCLAKSIMFSKNNYDAYNYEFVINILQSDYYLNAKTTKDSLKTNIECIEYYENGQILSKGKYKEGKKIGKWSEFYENGSTNLINHFDNDSLDGEFVKYYEDGQVSQQGTYRKGKRIGDWKEYDTNGNVDMEGNFSNGQVFYYYDRNKEQKIKEVQNYTDGKLNGVDIKYYSNGEIEEKTFYKEGKMVGESIRFSSSIDSESSYEKKVYGIFQGKQIYQEGRLVEEIQYYKGNIIKKEYFDSTGLVGKWEKDGNKGYSTYDDRTGVIEILDSEGLKKIKGNRKNGQVLHYEKDGSVRELKNYLNGELNGNYKSFYKGKIFMTGSFSNDYADGDWTMIYENGQLKFKGKCSPNGVVVNFSEIEKIQNLDYYFSFEKPIFFVGDCTYYYKNGKVLFKGNFTNGKVEYFLENGQLYMTQNYKDGKLNGESYKYLFESINGLKIAKYYYLNDSLLKIELYFENKPINNFRINELRIKTEIYEKDTEKRKDNSIELVLLSNKEVELKGYYSELHGFLNEKIEDYKNGNVIFYYFNGSKRVEGQLQNGNKIGVWTSFNEDGSIRKKVNYTDDLEISYYDNGNIEYAQKQKDFVKNGERIQNYRNGMLEQKSTFKNGKLSGEMISYYEDGKIQNISNYKNGELDYRNEDE